MLLKLKSKSKSQLLRVLMYFLCMIMWNKCVRMCAHFIAHFYYTPIIINNIDLFRFYSHLIYIYANACVNGHDYYHLHTSITFSMIFFFFSSSLSNTHTHIYEHAMTHRHYSHHYNVYLFVRFFSFFSSFQSVFFSLSHCFSLFFHNYGIRFISIAIVMDI